MDTRSYGLLFGFPLGSDHVGMNQQLLLGKNTSPLPAIESRFFLTNSIEKTTMFIPPLCLGKYPFDINSFRRVGPRGTSPLKIKGARPGMAFRTSTHFQLDPSSIEVPCEFSGGRDDSVGMGEVRVE